MDYQTESSQQLKEFVKIAKKEKYVEENEEVFKLLESIFKIDLSKDLKKHDKETVSYTHLTLPTILLV